MATLSPGHAGRRTHQLRGLCADRVYRARGTLGTAPGGGCRFHRRPRGELPVRQAVGLRDRSPCALTSTHRVWPAHPCCLSRCASASCPCGGVPTATSTCSITISITPTPSWTAG